MYIRLFNCSVDMLSVTLIDDVHFTELNVKLHRYLPTLYQTICLEVFVLNTYFCNEEIQLPEPKWQMLTFGKDFVQT